jgi:putative oxidoreductase
VVWILACLLLAGGLSLMMGFLTPIASMLIGLCAFGIALSWFPLPPVASTNITLSALLMVTCAVAIALLGPGAFSVDGQLFGRREIVIPPRSR